MQHLTPSRVRRFVRKCVLKATTIADNIVFNEAQRRVAKALLLGNLPHTSKLEQAHGYAGWGVILSVDLRGSSRRAVRIGPRDTYITMHTLLPAMAFLVSKAGGSVVGLRGDGLFAIFGLTKAPEQPKRTAFSHAACSAVSCGTTMIQVVRDYINPALTEEDIKGGLRIGVGIAVGSIVVTKIGWDDAEEVTTYGPAVNVACKFRGSNSVMVTKKVWDLLPVPDDDEDATIRAVHEGDGLKLVYTGSTLSMIKP